MKLTKSPRGVFEREITEADVQSQIIALLELNGAHVDVIVERIPWGRKTSTPGLPDLVGWFYAKPGVVYVDPSPRHFFIEVKRPGGKLRPAQAAWLEKAQRDGVIAFKAESVEEMVAEFKKYGVEVKGL